CARDDRGTGFDYW
nr:immunoglobulin heavy chain junction region [Macaca mulatta]